jgi:hypothetical protein
MPRRSSRYSRFNPRRQGRGGQQGTRGLPPDEHERLDSWLPAILTKLRPNDPLDTMHEPPTSGSIAFYDNGWHDRCDRYD